MADPVLTSGWPDRDFYFGDTTPRVGDDTLVISSKPVKISFCASLGDEVHDIELIRFEHEDGTNSAIGSSDGTCNNGANDDY